MSKGARIIVICAWCGKYLRSVDARGAEGGVSHGICTKCAKKEMEKEDKQ